MRVVEINVLPVDDRTPATARIVVDELRNGYWIRKESIDVTSGTPEARKKVVLSDSQQVTISPVVVEETVYDKEQMLARPMNEEEKTEKQKEALAAAPTVIAQSMQPAQAVLSAKPKPPAAHR